MRSCRGRPVNGVKEDEEGGGAVEVKLEEDEEEEVLRFVEAAVS